MAPKAPTVTGTIGILSGEAVLEKCDYFVDVHLWPTKSILNPQLWLQNFHSDELEVGHYLLNAFQFYSEELTNQLFVSGFEAIARAVLPVHEPMAVRRNRWREFLARATVTYVEGEVPNPSDSGFNFARRARQLAGIPEQNITTPDAALERILSNPTQATIFVDDFVGSGDQFLSTWHRPRTIGTRNTSFHETQRASNAPFYYAPLVCTRIGRENVLRNSQGVHLLPVHVLSNRDSLLAVDCPFWPEHLSGVASEVICKVIRRAGISSWKGYADLGLSLAFHHSTPDACLPLYYWNKNGWRPLINRT